MTDLRKAAEMALEVFDGPVLKDPTENAMKLRKACDLLRQALAQPEQESVICQNIYEVWAGSEGILKPLTSKEAYLLGLVEQMRDEAKKGLKPLYTAPQKREWVGLTDEEVEAWRGNYDFFDSALVREVEAKLKEKNT